MNTAFYSGLAGLSAYSNALTVVGNNLANINTTGFKFSDITFEDLVTRTFGGVATNAAGNPMQVGLGILPNSISGVFSQGSIQTTTDSTNAALEGNGFFVVGDTVDDRFYTRAGNFFFNNDGYLVNPGGKYVLGYTQKDADNNIIPSGPLSLIDLAANNLSAPQQSTEFQIVANLDVREADGDTYTSSVTIYDSKGASHTLTITFTHDTTAANDRWDYLIDVSDATVTAATDSGYIEFGPDGTLLNTNGGGPADINIDLQNFTNDADDMTVTWDIIENNVGFITGYPIPSATSSTNTDGYPPGYLSAIVIDQEGIIQGVFTNGQVEDIAQLAISQFNNPKGLLRMGHNLFAETNASGTPAIGAAGTGGRGTVVGSALEASNVDIAVEFTKMLVFERGYQANSRIITASDTLTQTALGIVR